MGSGEGLRISLILTGDVRGRSQLPTPRAMFLPVADTRLDEEPLPQSRSLDILACCISHCLISQGLESLPREEVFLGAFQFQPENIIQTFQLQVPGEAMGEQLLSVPHVQLPQFPTTPRSTQSS